MFLEQIEELDKEWVLLIKEAMDLGIPREDILNFFKKAEEVRS